MHKKLIIFSLSFLLAVPAAFSQELQARVTVLSRGINSTVDKKIFTTLQTQLNNLMNSRRWTNDQFQSNEKIVCSFILSVESILETNNYKATLTVQTARPIFNTSYQSALVNYLDADVAFKYVEFQPVEFNENRVQGTDASVANLPAILPITRI